jgi:protein-S-isoprenylcysteine O-methyltransferase Ste14
MTPWAGGSAASLAGLLFGLTYVLVVFAVQRSTAPLVMHGPFWLVSHPTYISLLANGVAIALLVPTALAVGAVLVCLLALQIQTRLVEEPHLGRLHSRAFYAYAARVDRFLSLVGRYRRTG